MATSFSFGGRSGVPGENHRPWASNWETLSLAAAYKAKKDETELSDMTGRFLDLSLMLQMALFSAWWIFFSSSKTDATLLAWYSFTLHQPAGDESVIRINLLQPFVLYVLAEPVNGHLRPLNQQVMPWNFQILYKYILLVRLICVKYRLRGEQISRAAIAAREIFPVLETGIFRK